MNREQMERRPAHVLMGYVDIQHDNYVTREMALDAECPEMEGQLCAGPIEQQAVWEDHEVVLFEDFDRYANDRDATIRQQAKKIARLRGELKNVDHEMAGWYCEFSSGSLTADELMKRCETLAAKCHKAAMLGEEPTGNSWAPIFRNEAVNGEEVGGE